MKIIIRFLQEEIQQKIIGINVQTTSDPQLRISDIVARWPEATHDQTIFNNSLLKAKLVNNEFDSGIILGDSGYQNT